MCTLKVQMPILERIEAEKRATLKQWLNLENREE